MALVNQTLKLEITPGGVPPVLHVTEYDENMQVVAQLFQRGQYYEIPSGTTAKVEGTLAGHPFSADATVDGSNVTFELTKGMTAYAGRAWTKIKLTQNSKPVSTCGFWLECDRAGVEAETVIGADGFQEQINQAVAEYIEDSGLIIDSTLSRQGAAADAKATGDAISELSEEIGDLALLNTEDQSSIVAAINEVLANGGGTAATYYPVTYNGDNVTWTSMKSYVKEGKAFSVEFAVNSGYSLSGVTVKMGGVNITNTAYDADSGTINISSVTGDVIITVTTSVIPQEEVIAHTWSNGVWKYDSTTETWAVDTATMSRFCIQQQIDATDGYLKIRFNRQNSYDQYMSDPATDCPMIEPMVANGIMNLATTKLSNLGNAALVEVADATWQKLEWNTDYYLPAGYIYRIQGATSAKPYVLDEDSLAYTAYSEMVRLGSSNANLKSIVTTDGFCTITKITGSGINAEASAASSVDAQYMQELGISTMSLVPDDVESEPTTYTGTMKKAISEWMIAYKGDTRKIPVIIHTDQHGRLSSVSKPIFTALGNLVPWYDVSKIINLGDCVGDHWEDADTANPFLACSDLEAMMECLAGIPISKRLDVYGNHDTWYHDVDGNDVVVPDQARLSQYFRNIFARNPNSNQQGYFVDYDNKYNVKYVVVSGFEYTTSRSTFRISTAQMKWLIGEMSKDDGYDIVVVSHVPLHYATENMTFPTGYEATGTENYRVSNVDTDALFAARKNKVSGTVTDSDGVEHRYDFSSCTTEVLCALHGHTHHDAYNYVGTNGLLSVSFDWFADNTMHFVLVDRVNRQLNVWKVDSTNTVQNYQVPLDKATE